MISFPRASLALRTLVSAVLSASALIVLGTGGAHAQPVQRIIGGKAAAPNAWPWMVALVAASNPDTTEAQFCGGTLIAGRYVLTAAHCVFFDYDYTTGKPLAIDPRTYKVFFGSQSLPFGEGNRVAVTGAVIHPAYNAITSENDIALVKIADPLPGPYAQPATFLDAAAWQLGTQGTILGWGITSINGPVLPTQLQEANVPVHSDADCLKNLGRWFKPASMTCAGKLAADPVSPGGVDACFGDSGGPLLAKDAQGTVKQYGITSWGLTQSCAGVFYGVFSEVSVYESFVFSRPTIAPVVFENPGLSGVPSIGSTLTCSPGPVGGDPVTSASYAWFVSPYSGDGSFVKVDGATGNTYLIRDIDAGAAIYCELTASNAGGSAVASSLSIYVDLPVPTPEPTPAFITEPPPVDVGTTIDTVAPSILSLALDCGKKSCTGLVSIVDDTGPVTGATVDVTARRRVPCDTKPSGVCTKVSKQTLALEPVSGNVWRVTFPRAAKATGTLVYRASDSAGNPASSTVGFGRTGAK